MVFPFTFVYTLAVYRIAVLASIQWSCC